MTTRKLLSLFLILAILLSATGFPVHAVGAGSEATQL